MIYCLAHPDPDRYLTAWRALERVRPLCRGPATDPPVRRELRRIADLEAALATVWLLLADTETDPKARIGFLRNAQVADPRDERIEIMRDRIPATTGR
jgi:hypothetical protein